MDRKVVVKAIQKIISEIKEKCIIKNTAIRDGIFGILENECTVISNKNVATFIKVFKVQLPMGAHMDFLPGSYAQIKIPAFTMEYD